MQKNIQGKHLNKNLEISDFIGKKLDKIFVKYLDLSVYDDDEDFIEDENTDITEIESIVFVFGNKYIHIGSANKNDDIESDELFIEFKFFNKTDINNSTLDTFYDKSLTKYVNKPLLFFWYNKNHAFSDHPLDMCALSFYGYPDIFIYYSVNQLLFFEANQIKIPPKTS